MALKAAPREAQTMLNLLARAPSPGSRGWGALLATALQESVNTKVLVGYATAISLSGMHNCIHPALRPSWKTRFRATRIVQQFLAMENSRKALVKHALATKEVFRRMLATALAPNFAQLAVAQRFSHPLAGFAAPPFAAVQPALEAGALALIAAGRLLVTGSDLDAALGEAFEAANNAESSSRTAWRQNGLAKGTLNVPQRLTMVNACAEVWQASFRCIFLPLWAHASHHSLRCTRLDNTQFKALHGLCAATQLAAQLPEQEALRIQRLALGHPSAGLLSIEDATNLLGISGIRGMVAGQGARDYMRVVNLLSAAGAEALSKMLVFARVAALGEELVVWDLGKKTKGMQVLALHRRLRIAGDLDGSFEEIADLHAGRRCPSMRPGCLLAVCAAGWQAAFAGWDVKAKTNIPHNELGLTSSMSCVESADPFTCHARCAKRGSAALRQAMNAEAAQVEAQIEDAEVDLEQTEKILAAGANRGDVSVAQRVRRDTRTSYEQRERALACGDEPMICVPLLGKAVRIFNEWFAHCSYCGTVVNVKPDNRFGGEICCLRCDLKLLRQEPEQPKGPSEEKACRFCGEGAHPHTLSNLVDSD